MEIIFFLIPPHPLTNFQIKKYYQNEPRFNGVYSRDKLPKSIKNGAILINLDGYADIGTHWIALYVKNIETIYFDSFGVEHIPKEIKEFTGNKDMKTNIFRIQANNSIMCGYFCIGFIDFMLAGKTWIDYTSLVCFLLMSSFSKKCFYILITWKKLKVRSGLKSFSK